MTIVDAILVTLCIVFLISMIGRIAVKKGAIDPAVVVLGLLGLTLGTVAVVREVIINGIV